MTEQTPVMLNDKIYNSKWELRPSPGGGGV